MKERLSNLLTVKSIVTLVLVAVFAYLAVTGVVSGQEFLTVFTVVISFYFGTQHQKTAGSVDPSQSRQSRDSSPQGASQETEGV